MMGCYTGGVLWSRHRTGSQEEGAMNLLERIACSNGDPLRTIEALRLINEGLERELRRGQPRLDVHALAPKRADLAVARPQPSRNTRPD